MKKNENYPKYVQAMRLMNEGKTAHYVCRHLKMGLYTLKLARKRYLQGGEQALLLPLHEPLLGVEQKKAAVEDILKKGLSLSEVALKYDISRDTLKRWVKVYQEQGKAGLNRKRAMKKRRQITETELDELEKLRKRNEYLEAENALLKKVKALVEERENRLRAIGRGPSKN